MSKQINCAFFFHDTDYYSGGSRSLLDIIDSYIEQNQINVIAVFPTNSGSAIDYLKTKDVCIVDSNYYQIRCDITESRMQWCCRLPYRLLRTLRSTIFLIFKTIPELKKNEVDVIYSNTSFILAGYWSAQKLQVPMIAHFREFGEEDHKISVWFNRKNFYRLVKNYNRIICISESLKLKYEQYLNPTKLCVVYDDVSKSYINFFHEKPDIANEFNILIAGNLTVGKGQLKVLNRISSLLKKDAKINVWIAGALSDKDYTEKIKSYIQLAGVENQVKILGLVESMNTLRKTMHVGIVFSDMEAFGRVTIEGMLSGLIMVASNVGGSPELLDNGKTGFLVNPDGSDLEETIEYICNNYDSLRDVQINGFDFAKKFTEGTCATKLAQVIKDMVEV